MDNLSHAILRASLTLSGASDGSAGAMTMPSHEDRSSMLRLRVLNGEDLTAEEMLYEVNKIREGRRTAEPRAKAPARVKKSPAPKENLLDLLDQSL